MELSLSHTAFVFTVHCIPYLLSALLDYDQNFSLCIFVTYSKQGTKPVDFCDGSDSTNYQHKEMEHMTYLTDCSLCSLSHMLLCHDFKNCCSNTSTQCPTAIVTGQLL